MISYCLLIHDVPTAADWHTHVALKVAATGNGPLIPLIDAHGR